MSVFINKALLEHATALHVLLLCTTAFVLQGQSWVVARDQMVHRAQIIYSLAL